MRRSSNILLFMAVLSTVHPLLGQQGDREIRKKSRELENLRDDIEAFEKKLKESEKKEKSTLERLDDLERQSSLIQKLIRKLREEEGSLTGDITTARSSISDLEGQLQFLKSHYAGYVRSVYKNGRVYDLELLFSSKSVNQLYIRIEYLKRFSDQRAKDLKRIVDHKADLENQNEELQAKLTAERKLLSEKTREEGTLTRKYSERRRVLTKVRKDKKTFQRGLTRKTEAVKEIERLIADLIEKERVRKEKEAGDRRKKELADARERERANSSVTLPALSDAAPASVFEQRRGKLRWPVSGGAIASRFGNQVHPVLKTVTQNA
ncbi:MAG: hypothetical protein AAB330_03470, partial [Bacteroidota bacterium]